MCTFHSWYIVAAKNCVLSRNQHFICNLAQMCSIYSLYPLGVRTVSRAHIDIASSTKFKCIQTTLNILQEEKLSFWAKIDISRPNLDQMCSFDSWYLVTVKTVFLSRHRLFYPDILLKCAVSTLCIVLGAKPVSGAQIDIPSSTKLTWHLARMCSFHSWYIVAAKNCVLRRNQHFAWHLAQMCSIHSLYLLGAKTVSGTQIDIPSSTKLKCTLTALYILHEENRVFDQNSTVCVAFGENAKLRHLEPATTVFLSRHQHFPWHLAQMCSFHSWYIVAAKNCVLSQNGHFTWHLAQMCSIYSLYLVGAKTVFLS